MNVEVVDFQSPDAPEAFTRSLRHTGFAVLVNHPLPQQLVQKIYDEWLAFFDSDAKHAYRFSDGTQDGYFGPEVSETAKGCSVRDIKEFFHVYPWGQYPAEVSDAALRYAEQAKVIATTLLGWVEANTPDEVSEQFSRPLNQMMDGSTRTLLRVLRYPPLRGDEPVDAVRAAAHEDINLITILVSATTSGLQLKDRDGTWLDIESDPNSLIVDAGDMLARATNDVIPSTTHRVVNPEGPNTARYSMPFFMHPNPDAMLTCLPSCRGSGEKYPPISSQDFLMQRLREIGLLK